MIKTQTILTRRKPLQILACAYGHIWPLSEHRTGYVLILNPVTQSYLWASNRATLEETRRELAQP